VEATFDIGFIPFLTALCLLGYAIFTSQRAKRAAYLPVVLAGITMLIFFVGLAWPAFSVLFWLLFGALTSRSRDKDAGLPAVT
jgi:hypothetical protein